MTDTITFSSPPQYPDETTSPTESPSTVPADVASCDNFAQQSNTSTNLLRTPSTMKSETNPEQEETILMIEESPNSTTASAVSATGASGKQLLRGTGSRANRVRRMASLKKMFSRGGAAGRGVNAPSGSSVGSASSVSVSSTREGEDAVVNQMNSGNSVNAIVSCSSACSADSPSLQSHHPKQQQQQQQQQQQTGQILSEDGISPSALSSTGEISSSGDKGRAHRATPVVSKKKKKQRTKKNDTPARLIANSSVDEDEVSKHSHTTSHSMPQAVQTPTPSFEDESVHAARAALEEMAAIITTPGQDDCNVGSPTTDSSNDWISGVVKALSPNKSFSSPKSSDNNSRINLFKDKGVENDKDMSESDIDDAAFLPDDLKDQFLGLSNIKSQENSPNQSNVEDTSLPSSSTMSQTKASEIMARADATMARVKARRQEEVRLAKDFGHDADDVVSDVMYKITSESRDAKNEKGLSLIPTNVEEDVPDDESEAYDQPAGESMKETPISSRRTANGLEDVSAGVVSSIVENDAAGTLTNAPASTQDIRDTLITGLPALSLNENDNIPTHQQHQQHGPKYSEVELKAKIDAAVMAAELEWTEQRRSSDVESRRRQELEEERRLKEELEKMKSQHEIAKEHIRQETEEKLEQQRKEFEGELATARAEVRLEEEGGDQREDLENQITALKSQLDVMKEENDMKIVELYREREAEIATVMEELEGLEGEQKKKEEELRQMLSAKDTVISALGAQLSERSTKIDAMEEHLTKSAEELEKSKAETEEALAAALELEKTMDAMRAEHEKAMAEEAKKRDVACIELRKDLMAQAESQFAEANVQYLKLQEECEDMEASKVKLEEELKLVREDAAKAEREIKAKEVGVQAELTKLKADLAATEAKAAHAAQKHNEEMERASREESELREKLKEAIINCDTSHKTLATIVTEKERLAEEYKEMKTICDELMAMVEAGGQQDVQ